MTLTPNFKTDSFFNVNDQWITTAPNEITHYHEQGDGVPILLLHGSGIGTCAAATWWLNIPSIAQVARCIAFDFIGYGETQIATPTTASNAESTTDNPQHTPFGIRAWGEHTLRLMDALNIEKAWLMGSSLGGWVALQLALDHPERILGVISVGTGGAQRDKPTSTHSHSANPTASKSSSTSPNLVKSSATKSSATKSSATKSSATKSSATNCTPAKPKLTASFIYQDLQSKIRNDDLISDTLVTLRLQSALKDQQHGLRDKLLQARDRDRVQLPLDMTALSQLRIPVLLIHGVNDQVVPMSHSLQLLQTIPTAEAHLLNNSGHWPHIGQADTFNSLVTNYLRHLL